MIRLLILCVLLSGCSPPLPFRFGPDPYEILCIDGETWAVNEHGRLKLGGECRDTTGLRGNAVSFETRRNGSPPPQ